MLDNFRFRDINEALPALCGHVTDSGLLVPSRLGDNTRELRHVGITLANPLNREVLVQHRNASIVAQIAETMWVLAGRNDIEWLGRYLPRAHEFSDDGATWRGAYGPRIRRWENDAAGIEVDQLKHVVDLLRADRYTRRAVIAIYDPAVDTQPGKDIPCNDFLHFTRRGGTVDLHVFIRSNDLIWGWSGINTFEWSVLLEIVAGLVGAEVGSIHYSISSLHIYDRHFDRAARIAKAPTIQGRWVPSPRFDNCDTVERLDRQIDRWFEIEAAARGGQVVHGRLEQIKNPLFRAFGRVIATHWSKDYSYMEPLLGTRLADAYSSMPGSVGDAPERVTIKAFGKEDPVATIHVPPVQEPLPIAVEHSDFASRVAELHAHKHAAYGDSWKRRGEMLGIMANVARKVDRLGSATATPDESQVDTAIDLLVYLIKYRWWLHDTDHSAPVPVHSVLGDTEEAHVATVLEWLPKGAQVLNEEALVTDIGTLFDTLEGYVASKRLDRYRVVDLLIEKANLLARHRDWKAGNGDRAWDPGEPVERSHTRGWPYRPTQPAREPQDGRVDRP